jgi:hypothetical protein
MLGRTARRILLAAGLVSAASGCAAQRELVITSDPPGALVRIDDQVVGLTPYTGSFVAYGTRRITLYREAYRTYSEKIPIEAPWYARFPFDVFSEVLLPFGWRDRHTVTVELEHESGEVTRSEVERVLERAEELRLAGPEGPRSSSRTPTPSPPKPEPAVKPVEPEPKPVDPEPHR